MSESSFPSSFRESLRFSFPASSRAASSAETVNGSIRNRPPSLQEDGCSYTRVVKSRCFLDQSSDGKPVKRCDRAEQILRNCVGRPQEVIESSSECTEEEVPDGWTVEIFKEEKGVVPFSHESLPWKPFQGMDPFSRGLSDGIESFMQAAEEMMNDALNQLGFIKREGRDDAAHPRIFQKKQPSDRIIIEDGNRPSREGIPSYKRADFKNSKSYDEV